MSDLRKLMSQLKISKETTNSNSNNKLFFPKNDFFYKIRFLPYFDNNNDVNLFKNIWYHYIDNKKIICSNKNCVHCDNNSKPSSQKFTNIKLIETNDPQYIKNNDYYIFRVPYSFYIYLDNYEKTNLVSLFDIYESPDVMLKVKNNTDFSDSFVCEDSKPLSDNLLNYKDEEIIAYLKEFVYNLDEEYKDMGFIEPENKIVNENINKDIETKKIEHPIIKEEIKEIILDDEIKNLKDNFANIDLNLNENISSLDVEKEILDKVEKTTLKEKKEEKPKEKIKKEKDETTSVVDSEINDLINDFMNKIDG